MTEQARPQSAHGLRGVLHRVEVIFVEEQVRKVCSKGFGHAILPTISPYVEAVRELGIDGCHLNRAANWSGSWRSAEFAGKVKKAGHPVGYPVRSTGNPLGDFGLLAWRSLFS